MPQKKNGKAPNKKPDKKAAPKAAAPKAAAKPAAKPAAAAPTTQSEKMRALYEKLHSASGQGGGPGQNIPGKKGGFDPHQFHAQGKGARHNTMMRRTQSRGGGSGGGGGGGGGGSSA